MGYIPSFCTACYRAGRTGDRFMEFCKNKQISNFCLPNALMTLQEYLMDYASPTTKAVGDKLIEKELLNIPDKNRMWLCYNKLQKIAQGERDFRF